MVNALEMYAEFVRQREILKQRRFLRPTRLLPDGMAERDGKILVNFSGNDYLGLSQHPAIIEGARKFALEYGAGSTASRLICGNSPVYERLEKILALGKGCENALIMGGGYPANLSIVAALADATVAGKPVTVLADRLCHNSLLQGVALSGARLARFRHNDCGHLETLLRKYPTPEHHIIIITESVFSMDGDIAPLEDIIKLAAGHNSMLYVDEAHATGLFGPGGYGLAAEHPGKIDIAMGTFGKALGSFGAYVACSHVLRDFLVQRCGALIYSTALPPPVLGAITAALDLLPSLDGERARLQKMAASLSTRLREQGWNCGASTTQIIPIILGSEDEASSLSARLCDLGFLVPAIRPPTVPPGSSRLRISLGAAHKEEAVESFAGAMAGLASCKPVQ